MSRAVRRLAGASAVLFLFGGPGAALLSSAPGSAEAAADAPAPRWVQTAGPQGGMIHSVAVNPTRPSTIYAGGAAPWVFKSDDGGSRWRPLKNLTKGSAPIVKVLISPNEPDTVWAQTGLSGRSEAGLFKSVDGGITWREFPQFQNAVALSLAPQDGSTVIVALDEGNRIWGSRDGGANWSDITSNLPAGQRITALGITGDGRYWAGLMGPSGGGLYRSGNRGSSWEEIKAGQGAGLGVRGIFVDPALPGALYAGFTEAWGRSGNPGEARLFATSDGGSTWRPIYLPDSTRPAGPRVIGKASKTGTLYLANGLEVFASSDGGRTWRRLPVPQPTFDPNEMAVDPADNQRLYLPVRSAAGVLRSTDGGETWSRVNDGLISTIPNIVVAHPARESGTVFAGGDGMVFRTKDRGQSWEGIDMNLIDDPWVYALAVNPLDPDAVWFVASTGRGYVSKDAGTTWEPRIHAAGEGFRYSTISAVASAPSDPDIIYAVKSGFGIFKSGDGGENWQFLQTSDVDYSYSLAVDPADPRIVYSGYSPKPFQPWAMVRKSTDGGENWQTVLKVDGSGGITSVALDPGNRQTVYAGSTGKQGGTIFRSGNGGSTWSQLNPRLTFLTVWGQPQLIADAAKPGTVYAATWLAGTWRTSDAGQSWFLMEQAPISSTALSLQSGESGVLYSADRTAPRVWMSADGGARWSMIADFEPEGAFLVNRVLAAGDAVYASTFGPGLHSGKLYKSADGGRSWNDITNGLPRSVLDIAVSPADPETVYVTTHIHGAFKSSDGGRNWVALDGFPDIGGYDIEIDPAAPQTIYAAGMGEVTVPEWVMPGGYTLSDDSGAYRSTDGGATWKNILRTRNEGRAIRIHPRDRRILFAAALDHGLLVSNDGGENWTEYGTGLDTLALTSCAVTEDKVYVGTQGYGVYSGDVDASTGAVTWRRERSNKPVPPVHSMQIAVDPSSSDRIFVGVNPGGLFRSDDGGKTFYDKNFLTPSVPVADPVRQGYYTFALHPEDPREVWLGTYGRGIFKSYDAMDFDITANGNDHRLARARVNSILVNREYGVLAATDEGVYQSTDGGETWADFSSGLPDTQIRVLHVKSNGNLLAGASGYEFYSRRRGAAGWSQLPGFGNFGAAWAVWDRRPMYQYTSLLFHPADPNIMYIGTFPAGMFRSADGGKNWREINTGFLNDGVFSMVFHPRDPQTIFAGTYNGVSVSRDGGERWQRMDEGWPPEQWVFAIDFDPRNPDVMYACSKNGENMGHGRAGFKGIVMKSIDGGFKWNPAAEGLELNQEFYKIVVDPELPDTLYLATQYEGVFISRDAGAHWSAWNDGLDNLPGANNGNNIANCLSLSADGAYLYYGTLGTGVYRRGIR